MILSSEIVFSDPSQEKTIERNKRENPSSAHPHQSGAAGGDRVPISIAVPPVFVFQEYEVPAIVLVRHGETEIAQVTT